MIDCLMILAGGLLGSSHCVGMCGGFALALGAGQPSVARNLARQLTYCLGRVTTYTLAGLTAGYGGWRLIGSSIVDFQAVLSLVAGALLICEGLLAAGVFHWRTHTKPCLAPGMFGALLRASRLRSAYLGGVVNGLLPCGLVYAYLALAGSSGTMAGGGATMLLFGLGTVPLMVLVGCGGSIMSLTFRRHMLGIAAWCVVLTGVVTILRGVGFLESADMFGGTRCPFCQ